MRKTREIRVSDDQSQPTMRELRQHMMQPTTQVAILGVAGILAIAGPFETGEVLRLVPRFAYWLVLVAASYAFGFLISEGVRKTLTGSRQFEPRFRNTCWSLGAEEDSFKVGADYRAEGDKVVAIGERRGELPIEAARHAHRGVDHHEL